MMLAALVHAEEGESLPTLPMAHREGSPVTRREVLGCGVLAGTAWMLNGCVCAAGGLPEAVTQPEVACEAGILRVKPDGSPQSGCTHKFCRYYYLKEQNP